MLTQLWMKQDVTHIQSDTPIGEAKDIIDRHNFRHLPVTKGEKLIGIITQNDINKALPSPIDSSMTSQEKIIANQAKVSSFMIQNPITVTPLTPLEEVASLFRIHKIGAIPVVKDGTLIGIITESDIFDAFIAIMEGEKNDIRVELQTKRTQNDIYKIVALCQQFEVSLNSISIYKNFSPEHQLVTIRVNGTQTDNLVDALWDSGMKINQITTKSEE
jgi:acetoin utilization protein AcuB